MAAKNDVTGDRIASKANSQEYRDGMDRIFGKKKAKAESEPLEQGEREWLDAPCVGLECGADDHVAEASKKVEPDAMRPLKG